MSKKYIPDYDKKQTFNRLWFKNGNSPVRDRLKAKVQQRGLSPTEKMCYEYWMGYIKSSKDRRGNVVHENPRWSKYNNEKKGNRNPRRMGKHHSKKGRRFNK